MDKNTKIGTWLDAGIVAVAAFPITSCFPSGYPFVSNGSLSGIYALSGGFALAFSSLIYLQQHKIKIPQIIVLGLSRLALGTFLGLAFGAFQILDQWYAEPEANTWEPLLLATIFSSVAILSITKQLLEFHSKM